MDLVTEKLLTGWITKMVSSKPLKGIVDLKDLGVKVMITKIEHKDDISDIEGHDGFLLYDKKDFKGPICVNHFYVYSQNVCKLWHGSKVKLDTIKCFESNHSLIKNGNPVPVCFASINRFISASFIPHWNDSNFTHGVHNGKWYMIEMHKDAFKILEMKGYLHRVANEGFYRVPSLGLEEEYINEKEQQVLEVIEIPNCREYIKDFFIFKPWELVWKSGNLKEYDGEGQWHHDIFKKELDPVVIENGKITKNEHLAKLAKFLGQPFAYV